MPVARRIARSSVSTTARLEFRRLRTPAGRHSVLFSRRIALAAFNQGSAFRRSAKVSRAITNSASICGKTITGLLARPPSAEMVPLKSAAPESARRARVRNGRQARTIVFSLAQLAMGDHPSIIAFIQRPTPLHRPPAFTPPELPPLLIPATTPTHITRLSAERPRLPPNWRSSRNKQERRSQARRGLRGGMLRSRRLATQSLGIL